MDITDEKDFAGEVCEDMHEEFDWNMNSFYNTEPENISDRTEALAGVLYYANSVYDEYGLRKIRANLRSIATTSDIVTDEEVLQWGLAFHLTFQNISKKVKETEGKNEDDSATEAYKSKEIQDMVGEIMNRPMTKNQLAVLMLVNTFDHITSTEKTPFFYYLKHMKVNKKEDSHKYYEVSKKLIDGVMSTKVKSSRDNPKTTLMRVLLMYSDNYSKNDHPEEILKELRNDTDKALAHMMKEENEDAKSSGRYIGFINDFIDPTRDSFKDPLSNTYCNYPLFRKAYEELCRTYTYNFSKTMPAMGPQRNNLERPNKGDKGDNGIIR